MNAVPDREAAGPLAGLRVLEFASTGPGPHCAMLLSDFGAEVLRIERPGGTGWANPVVDRGRHSLEVDVRMPNGRDVCRAIAEKVDVVLEGLRPGTMERLGLGPDTLCAANPRLIYARLTGWGQTGPRAKSAGHDINYIALTGALASMGPPDGPVRPPLNLVGDFGGGSLFAVVGVLTALHERERSGLGQVIDAAIVDGTASLMAMLAGLLPRKAISLDRRANLLGGAAPFYRCYRCADGKEIAVGALEPKFYQRFIEGVGAPRTFLERQNDVRLWPRRAAHLARIFRGKTRDEWIDRLGNLDACVAPVLELEESYDDPHLAARGTYAIDGDTRQAAPAPRLSRTPGRIQTSGPGSTLLQRWAVRVPEILEYGTVSNQDESQARLHD